jgi:hypothetical protein
LQLFIAANGIGSTAPYSSSTPHDHYIAGKGCRKAKFCSARTIVMTAACGSLSFSWICRMAMGERASAGSSEGGDSS